MRHWSLVIGFLTMGALVCPAAFSQQPAAPAPVAQPPTIKTGVEEVLLDIIAQDKKGRPITDLKAEELTVLLSNRGLEWRVRTGSSDVRFQAMLLSSRSPALERSCLAKEPGQPPVWRLSGTMGYASPAAESPRRRPCLTDFLDGETRQG